MRHEEAESFVTGFLLRSLSKRGRFCRCEAFSRTVHHEAFDTVVLVCMLSFCCVYQVYDTQQQQSLASPFPLRSRYRYAFGHRKPVYRAPRICVLDPCSPSPWTVLPAHIEHHHRQSPAGAEAPSAPIGFYLLCPSGGACMTVLSRAPLTRQILAHSLETFRAKRGGREYGIDQPLGGVARGGVKLRARPCMLGAKRLASSFIF